MVDMDHHLLAKRLKQARIFSGLTQSEVAGKIGVHKTTIMRWEKGGGTHHIKIPVISALADIFRVSPAFLMGWTDDPLAKGEEKPTLLPEGTFRPDIRDHIGESEANAGLKHLLAFYGLPWQEYDDALLLKLINSDLLRNLLNDCLRLLQQ
ncbi:MAG: helix-turn-helix domain-containing protein [Clostridiales bacterium]|nr:helix-turn-helix domain-containing protein [Clostridiales bacterium]